MAAEIEVRAAGDAVLHADLASIYDAAWAEAKRKALRTTWRPFPEDAELFVLHEGGEPVACAALRAMPGMDSLDFLYALPGLQREGHLAALLERVEARHLEIGLSKILYVAFGFWHDPSRPDDLFGFLTRRGWRGYDGVYLYHPLDPLPPEAPVPPGYELRPFRDEQVPEAAAMMLKTPEPEAIYWDAGLCMRSIVAAAAPSGTRFPDGLGQVVLRERGEGKKPEMVAFSLATVAGYVNHVYTLEEHRGKGLAAAMVTRVLAAIRRRGVKRATILTHAPNPGAIRLYERLGFHPWFRYPQYFLHR